MKKLVIIKWRDSNMELSQSGTKDSLEVAIIYTVGFLIKKTRDSVILCRDLLTDDTECRGKIVIPKENILTISTLTTK